ncbi:unnamed protein product [Meganyctiphanes norvegica]|uniref:Uncharacterized protein n=1 Tax=Meganyctiphanes norvegica TaxID=48144 RepID=A0AAV2Q6B9_MEGNR
MASHLLHLFLLVAVTSSAATEMTAFYERLAVGRTIPEENVWKTLQFTRQTNALIPCAAVASQHGSSMFTTVHGEDSSQCLLLSPDHRGLLRNQLLEKPNAATYMIPNFLVDIDFNAANGTMEATNEDSGSGASNPYLTKGSNWHFGTGSVGFPQSIWCQFPSPLIVRRFSFKSRPHSVHDGESLSKTDGPTNYEIFASNEADCSLQSEWVTLFTDDPGTPFTELNEPKIADVGNIQPFTCYGFKVNDVNGRKDGSKYVTMSEIHYYAVP